MLRGSQVLAKLPGQDPKPLSVDVYELVGRKKRKRSELAVSVDRVGISIYDIQSAKRATSYSVSPQADFTCPPCSIRQRIAGHGAQRLTYCSIAEPKPRLQCFAELCRRRNEVHGSIHSTSRAIGDSSSPIIFLEAIKTIGSNDENLGAVLLALHEDADLRLVSGDLSEEYWKIKVDFIANGTRKSVKRIHYAATIHIDEARKGLFKDREDIMAKFDANSELAAPPITTPQLLLLLGELAPSELDNKKTRLCMGVFSLPADVVDVRRREQPQSVRMIEQLVSLPLPMTDEQNNSTQSFYFHSSSGVLYHTIGKFLRLYDFTGRVPRVILQLRWPHTIHSCVRLSSTSVVLTSQHSISILDTHYKSIVASTKIKSSAEKINGDGSPRGKDSDRKMPIRVISYFISHLVAIAIQGRSLLLLRIADVESTRAMGRKRNRCGKLIDALGRGMESSRRVACSQSTGNPLPNSFGQSGYPERVDTKWQAVKDQLDLHASNGDTTAFDSVVIAEFGIQDDKAQDRTCEDRMLRPELKANPPRSKLAYLVAKLFRVKEDSKAAATLQINHSPLEIKFYPKRTVQWLVMNGLLLLSTVESALREYKILSPTSKLPPCALVQAIVTCDPSCHTLQSLLAASAFLSPEEVVYATHIAIIALNQRTDSIQFLDEKSLAGADSLFESQQINGDVVHTLTKLPHTSHNIQLVLASCLKRLRYCHEIDVRKAFSQKFSHVDLLSFIDYLRIFLARGGWFSRYIEDGHISCDSSQKDDQMSIVTKLLNCAIDCLGTNAWLTSASNATTHAETAETILYLKAEVSAALQGIEEAAYLQAVLNEVLLFDKSVKNKTRSSEADSSRTSKPITVNVVSWEDHHALPLGLRADQAVGLTKIGAGGEVQERTMRDVGRLKSRKVGAYSFERIML